MTVLWSIYDRNGAVLPLDDKEVHLYYTCERGRYEAEIEIQDSNVVAWTFHGRDQKAIGSYALTLEIMQSEGKRKISKDVCLAFILVGRECEEEYDDSDALINEGGEITLTSELDIYRIQPIIPYIVEDEKGVGYWHVDGVNTYQRSSGKSAYEIAVEFGGYEGTEEEFGRALNNAVSTENKRFGYSQIENGKEQYFADKTSADLYNADRVANRKYLLHEIVLPSGGTGGGGMVDSVLSPDSTNPVQNNTLYNAFSNKVDKVAGKGLSTEDFTTALKDKLESLGNGEGGDLGPVAEEVEALAQRTGVLETEQSVIKGRLGDVEEEVAEMRDRTGAVEDANRVIDASLSGLGTRLDSYDTVIGEINQKLDGVVESFFEKYTPANDNAPASTWIAEGTEADHVGDTFTNVSLEGDDAGKSWRWLKQDDGSYSWQPIADSDAAKALVLAGQAMAAIDGKISTFVTVPSNYKKGDIWIVGDDIPAGVSFDKGDILTADTSSVTFIASHWYQVVSYVSANEYNSEIAVLDKAIDDALKASKDYTDAGQLAVTKAVEALEKSKANLKDIYKKAEVDGFISNLENEALELAREQASAAKKFTELTQKVYADGVVTEEELRQLKEAEEELKRAQQALDYAVSELEKELAELDAFVKELQIVANSAVDDAHAAYQKAEDAKGVADSAKGTLDSWLVDGVITPVEKEAIRSELAFIEDEYNGITADCERYGISNSNGSARAAFASAYTSYYGQLAIVIATQGVISEVTANYLRREQKEYYTARKNILDQIAAAAKALADSALLEAQNAKNAANAAKAVTDNLNNDLVFSLTEKRSIRKSLKEINSSESPQVNLNDTTGSLADYLAICAEKGVDGSAATRKANALFTYLYGMGVWMDNDTALEANDNFRENVYRFFREYHAVITSLQQDLVDADYHYLTYIFGRGNTVDQNGAILSQMLAVKNDSGEIEAMLNGSKTVANDTEHGTLLLAGGIPSKSSSGSTAFKERAKEAESRLYEDGHFVAASGRIGNFEVTPEGLKLKAGSPINLGTPASPSWIYVDTDITFNYEGIKISNSGKYIQMGSDGLTVGEGNNTYLTIGLPEMLSGGETQVQIASRAGTFAGLRPQTRVITSSSTSSKPYDLTDTDHTVIVDFSTSGASVYLRLPSSPQDGQEYHIYTTDQEMKLYVQSAKPIHNLVNGNTYSNNDYTFTGANRRYIRLNYSATTQKWYSSYQYLS